MDQNLKKARYDTCQKKRPLNKHKADRKFVLKNELLILSCSSTLSIFRW